MSVPGQYSSLVGSFKRVSKVVPDALKDMVDNSEHINVSNLEHLKSLAVSAQAGSSETLQGWIKNLVKIPPLFSPVFWNCYWSRSVWLVLRL